MFINRSVSAFRRVGRASTVTIAGFSLFLLVQGHADASPMYRHSNRMFLNVIGGRSAFDAIKARSMLDDRRAPAPEAIRGIQIMSESVKIVAGTMLLVLASCLTLLVKLMMARVSLPSDPRKNRQNRLKLCRPT